MSKGELKPCPFCGGKAKMNNAVGEWWVTCVQCEEGNMSATEEAAVAIWNARTVHWIDASERTPDTIREVLMRLVWPDGSKPLFLGTILSNQGGARMAY